MQQLVLVVLRASKFAYDLAKRVILRRTEGWEIIDDEVVNSENVCKLDIQRWLGTSEQVVELVDLEVRLSVTHIDEIRPDILQAVDSFSDVAVEWLQVEVFAAEQPSCCYLS